MPRTILFDFDGTLADSEEIMFESFNTLAQGFRFAPLTRAEFPALRQLPMRRFITERLRIPLWRVWTLLSLERKAKGAYAKASRDLHLFAGVPELIEKLHGLGILSGVVASAPQEVVERVLAAHKVKVDFVHAGIGTFSKARAIQATLKVRRLLATQVCYVGDELRDLDACKKAGIKMLGVSWGLNDAATLRAAGLEVASTPEELLSMLTA